MKLRINRNQASGMFGGVKFELKAQVQLTPDEAALVSKYKVEKEVLAAMEAYKQALLKRDATAMAKLLADDLTYTHSSNLIFSSDELYFEISASTHPLCVSIRPVIVAKTVLYFLNGDKSNLLIICPASK